MKKQTVIALAAVFCLTNGTVGESQFVLATSSDSNPLWTACRGGRFQVEQLLSRKQYLIDRIHGMRRTGSGNPEPLLAQIDAIEMQIYALQGGMAINELRLGDTRRAAAIIAYQINEPPESVSITQQPSAGRAIVNYGNGNQVEMATNEIEQYISGITGARCN